MDRILRKTRTSQKLTTVKSNQLQLFDVGRWAESRIEIGPMREQYSSSKQTESLNWVSWGVNWFALFGPHVFLQPIRMAPGPSLLTASHFRSSPHHFLSNKTLPVPATLLCLLFLPHSCTFSSHTPAFTTNPTVIHSAFSHFLLVTSYKVKCLPSLEHSTCNAKLLNIEVV